MSAPCPHAHPGLEFPRDPTNALVEGRRRCEAAGERWTPPRHRTYELLLAAPGPMKAYDLLREYQPGSGATKPPTIYRSLDFLMALGLVHKVQTLSAYVACAQGAREHSAGFLICDCCGRVDELDEDLATLTDDARHGYAVESVRLEISGRCPDCR